MGRGSSKTTGGGGNIPKNAVPLTDEEAQALKDQYESGFDAATQKSVDKYISNTNFDGNQHSLSQVMNHIINEGGDLQTMSREEINSKYGLNLTQNQFLQLQKTDANIDAAMHPIGKDMILQRGCHEGDLKRLFGIKDYTKMTEAELQEKLVGGTFKNRAVMSTSYNVNSNPFLGNGPASGGRELVYNIKAGAKTKGVFGAMNQTEVILGKGQNWRVTGVHFTGKTAFPKDKGKHMPQLQIDIETY